MSEDVCNRCEGKGWFWRVPEGFNPFLAGGFKTAQEMYKATCLCVSLKKEEQTLEETSQDGQ